MLSENISMEYPTRKNHLALGGLNLRLQGGQVNAITGTSGGGKSSELAWSFFTPPSIMLTIFLQQYLHCYSASMILLKGV